MLFVFAALEVRDALAARTVTEQALECELRIVFRRQGLVRRCPREVVFVGAGVTRVAFAGFAYHVAGQFQRSEARLVPDLVGNHLVDGDASLDVRAGGLLDAYAREEGAARTCVIAGTIRTRIRTHAIQTRNDLQRPAHVGQRRERGREGEIRTAFAGWPPGPRDGAIRHIY